MVGFKPKNSKKLIVSNKKSTTLDSKHKEIIETITRNECDKLPELLKKKKNIKKRIKKCENIDKKLDLEDNLKKINREISKIKSAKKDYFLENSKYLFGHYENTKNNSKGNNKKIILNSFFNIENTKEKAKEKKTITNVQQYLSNVDERFIDINNFVIQTDICRHCNKGEMILVESEGKMYCNNCFVGVKHLFENEKPSYKEPPKEVCFYAYKRINHFREILAQFQAKETTQIPEDVIQNIKRQIKKERIKPIELTNKKAKEILKKLGYNRYYEHIPFIKDKLGIKPPIMTPELEERLCSLFMDIQAPYAKYCPENRVNFLNYYYTVYKLCELLGQKQFLPFFPMLKDKEKIIEQDEIWRKICDELDWEYFDTPTDELSYTMHITNL